MLLVVFERAAIAEHDEEGRIVRTPRSDHVGANLQVDNSVYVSKGPQALPVSCARGFVDIGLVLEADDVYDHQSSSPSISSSAMSTTTL